MSSRLCRTALARTGTARLVSLSVVATAALLGTPGAALAQSAGEEPTASASTSPSEPAPEPTVEPAPESTVEPAPESTVEPTPEPTVEPAPEVTAEPTPEVGDAPAPETTDSAAAPEVVAPAPVAAAPAPTTDPSADAVRELAAEFADFGTGKVYVSVEPEDGSIYPEGVSLAGAQFEITAVDGTIIAPDFGTPTALAAEAARRTASRVLAATPDDPDVPNDTQLCTTDADGFCDPYLVTGSEVTVRQISAPAGFLLAAPPSQTLDPETDCAPSGLPVPGLEQECDAVFVNAGVFRTLGLDVTSSVDGTPLEGAAYTLCEAVESPAVTGLACPEGSEPLDTATADENGELVFDELLLPSAGYTVFQTATAPGYVQDAAARILTVPAADSVEEAEEVVVVAVTNDPDVDAPVAVADAASTTPGKAVDIAFLANDDLDGAELLDLEGTEPQNGAVEIVESDGGEPAALRYTPAPGFAGTDSFTYVLTTRGGSDTATVTVTVTAPPANAGGGTVVTPRGGLPVTGAEAGQVLLAAAALLGTGGVLLLAGSSARTVRVRRTA